MIIYYFLLMIRNSTNMAYYLGEMKRAEKRLALKVALRLNGGCFDETIYLNVM